MSTKQTPNHFNLNKWICKEISKINQNFCITNIASRVLMPVSQENLDYNNKHFIERKNYNEKATWWIALQL